MKFWAQGECVKVEASSPEYAQSRYRALLAGGTIAVDTAHPDGIRRRELQRERDALLADTKSIAEEVLALRAENERLWAVANAAIILEKWLMANPSRPDEVFAAGTILHRELTALDALQQPAAPLVQEGEAGDGS